MSEGRRKWQPWTCEERLRGLAAAKLARAQQRAERERELAELDPTAAQIAAAEAFCARKEPLPSNRPFTPRFA